MSEISRRNLLAAAGAAPLNALQPEKLDLGRTVRLAVIGDEGHLSEITDPMSSITGLTVAGVSHPDAVQAGRLAANKRLGKPKAYADWRRMLDSEKPDAVLVNNDNGARAEAIIECLSRKMHVIAEKPLALTTADLARIRDGVAKNRLHLGCLLKMRTDPWFIAMKNLVASGTLGDVVQVATQKSYKYEGQNEWKKRKSSYGGTIPWIGVDLIDLMRYASGRDMAAAAAFHCHIGLPELGEMENSAACLFRLDNGGMATLRLDYLRTPGAPTHGDDRLRIAGTLGIVEYQAATGVTLERKGEKPRKVEDLPPRGYVFLDFLSAAFLGKKPALPASECIRTTEVALAAWTAAQTGKWVTC